MCDANDSRRSFLKRAAALVAGAALLPRALSAAEGGHGTGAEKPAHGARAGGHAAGAASAHGPVSNLTPEQAIRRLLTGNARYVAGKSLHADESAARRAELAKGQAPFAIILGCADSRVSPEILFDEGLGDLFVIRVAGNIVDDAGIGSMEYAVEHLGSPLIVVLGHERCGAVKATIETLEAGSAAPGRIGALVEELRPAVEAVKGQPGDKVENAVRENVRRLVAELSSLEPFFKARVAEGKLQVVGMRYDLDTGVMEMI